MMFWFTPGIPTTGIPTLGVGIPVTTYLNPDNRNPDYLILDEFSMVM